MRIISGTHRGRKLHSPRGKTIRPTTDRVREAIFNILGPLNGYCAVLDLFSGTGALALEALSRGVDSALLIDHDPAALAISRKNIRTLAMDSRTRLLRWNIARNLKCLYKSPVAFDLVFMDPPYDRGLVTHTLGDLPSTGALAPGARLVVEHSAREIPDITGLPYHRVDKRRYGKVLVAFFTFML